MSASHHHYLTDALVSDQCTEKRSVGQGGEHKVGVRLGMPKVDLYFKDKVHLNSNGNVLFGRMHFHLLARLDETKFIIFSITSFTNSFSGYHTRTLENSFEPVFHS